MSIIGALITAAAEAWTTLLALARGPAFKRLAAVFGALVLLLLGLHLVQLVWGDRIPALEAYQIDRDRGLSEGFEYLMSFTAAVCLLLCLQASHRPLYASLAGLHLWLMLDNALQLHERMGARLEAALTAAGGPPLGESLVFAVIMLVIALVVGVSLWRAPGAHRAVGLALIAAATPMAAFAAGVDLVHGRLAAASPLLDQTLILLEDGGELTLFAVNACFAIAAWSRLRAGVGPNAARIELAARSRTRGPA